MHGMKISTIKKVIRRKVDDWLQSIEDHNVRAAAAGSAIVSGGCIASMLGEERVNDYDVYFRSRAAASLVAKYYVDRFNATVGSLPKGSVLASYNPEVREESRININGETEERVFVYLKSAGVASEESTRPYEYFEGRPESAADDFVDELRPVDQMADDIAREPVEAVEGLAEALKPKKERYRPVFFTENAITLSEKVQLITRFYGEGEEILRNYDYEHCCCWYDRRKDELVVMQAALESVLSKSLVYRGSLYPVASVFRLRKFLSRGWRITAGQILKMLMQISAVDLTDARLLREQLIGVDQAYMSQLLDMLKAVDPQKVDAAYLAKIVDEVFG